MSKRLQALASIWTILEKAIGTYGMHCLERSKWSRASKI